MGHNQDSDRLVEAARSGDEQAMMELIKLVMPVVESEAGKAQTFGAVTGYDLVQEGMLGFLNAVFSYREGGEASFLTYAGVCIKNSITSALRAQGRKKHRPLNSSISISELQDNRKDAELGAADSPENILIDSENARNLREEINQALSRMEREVLDCYLDGLDYHEIAGRMNRTPKSIDNALQRIRGKVRQIVVRKGL